MRRFSTCAERPSIFANEHFIRSRSFSGWTHTSLVSRATASPKKRHVGAVQLTFDVDHNALEGPGFALGRLLSGERKCARGSVRKMNGRRFKSAFAQHPVLHFWQIS